MINYVLAFIVGLVVGGVAVLLGVLMSRPYVPKQEVDQTIKPKNTK